MKISSTALFLLTIAAFCCCPSYVNAQSDGLESSAPSQAAPPGGNGGQTDTYTGSYSYKIPIELPIARHDFSPEVSITYNSSSAGSALGTGWSIPISMISRRAEFGPPIIRNGTQSADAYDDSKGFNYNFAGSSGELIRYDNYQMHFSPRIVRQPLKFEYVGPHWVVTDNLGTRYYFGENAQSRSSNPRFSGTDLERTYAWYLEKAEDLRGNIIRYSYTEDQGILYPSKIEYNLSSKRDLHGTSSVRFRYEPRSDFKISYRYGTRTVISQRLKDIEVYIGDSLLKRYKLDYQESASTRSSLLSKVTQLGSDDISALPPISFQYSQLSFRFGDTIDWPGVWGPTGEHRSLRARQDKITIADLIDMNNDGLADRIMYDQTAAPGSQILYQLNNGSGFDPVVTDIGYYPAGGLPTGSDQKLKNLYYVRNIDDTSQTLAGLYDINGDGQPEKVYASGLVTPANSFGVHSSLILQPWFHVSCAYSSLYATLDVEDDPNDPLRTVAALVDLSGDGLVDRVCASPNGWSVQINQNHPGGSILPLGDVQIFSGPVEPTSIYRSDASGSTSYQTLVDMNGDGLADILRYHSSTPSQFWVQFNQGDGFTVPQAWGPVSAQCSSGYCQSPHGKRVDYPNATTTRTALIDINADGLPDRVMVQANNQVKFLVQLNTGSGFSTPLDWTNLQTYGSISAFDPESLETFLDMVDINGDGLVDRVFQDPLAPINGQTKYLVQLNEGGIPDLLSRVSNGLGAKIEIEYSTANKATQTSIGTKMPFPMPVVSKLSVDGFETYYQYLDAAYSFLTREFRGFGATFISYSAPRQNKRLLRHYHQDDHRKGLLISEEEMEEATIGGSASQTLVSLTENIYKTYPFHAGTFPYLSSFKKYEFSDGPNSIPGWYARVRAKKLEYSPSTLNLVKETDFGEVAYSASPDPTISDIKEDLLTTSLEYAQLSDPSVTGLPSKTIVRDYYGNKVSEEYINYNSQGQPKGVFHWLDTEDRYIGESYQYDQLGLIRLFTAPDRVVTEISWDPELAYTVMSNKTVVDLAKRRFTTLYQFNPNSGKIVSERSLDGNTRSYEYDTHGRLLETYLTGRRGTRIWLEQYQYETYSDDVPRPYYGSVTTKIRNDGLLTSAPYNGMLEITYADSYGRKRCEVSKGASTSPSAFLAKRTDYNSIGEVTFKSFPFDLSQASGSSIEACLSKNLTSGEFSQYDQRSRLIKRSWGAAKDEAGSPLGDLTMTYGPLNNSDTAGAWRTKIKDARGNSKLITYDARGKVDNISYGTGGFVSYNYTALGELSLINRLGQYTLVQFDSLKRKILSNDPSLGSWSYVYDDVGRIIEQTNSKGEKIKSNFDALGRPLEVISFDQSGTKYDTITYHYDESLYSDYYVPIGALAMAMNKEGWTAFNYDEFGNVVETSQYVTKNNKTYLTQYKRDAIGRIKLLVYPNGIGTIKYDYDPTGKAEKVSLKVSNGNWQTLFTLNMQDAAGRILGSSLGNGVSALKEFYPLSQRLRRLAFSNTKGLLGDLTYSYDPVSNLSSIADGVAANNLSDLQYDNFDQLKRYTRSGQFINFSAGYDGNIYCNEENSANSCTIGANYLYHPLKKDAVIRDALGRSFNYDNNGNMTSIGNRSLHYDPQGQLVEVAVPGAMSTKFGYDYQRNRVWREGGSGLTVWVDELCEDGPEKFSCFVRANGERIATLEKSRNNSNNQAIKITYNSSDHLSSNRILTDSTGNLINRMEYGAFGSLLSSTNSTADTSHLYTDQIYDADTGLYYYKARYYDPLLGRFIQPDSIIPDPYDILSLNRYAYARNNPLRYNDPSGHNPILIAALVNTAFTVFEGMIGGASSEDLLRTAAFSFIGGLLQASGASPAGMSLYSFMVDVANKQNPILGLVSNIVPYARHPEIFGASRSPISDSRSLSSFTNIRARNFLFNAQVSVMGITPTVARTVLGGLSILGNTFYPSRAMLLPDNSGGQVVGNIGIGWQERNLAFDIIDATLLIFGMPDASSIDFAALARANPDLPRIGHSLGGGGVNMAAGMGFIDKAAIFGTPGLFSWVPAREGISGNYNTGDVWFRESMHSTASNDPNITIFGYGNHNYYSGVPWLMQAPF